MLRSPRPRLSCLLRGDLASTHPTATACAATVPSVRALGCAVLLHDVGKGYGPGHHDRGAELARAIGPRLGLAPDEVDLVRLLVRHQADMALTCTRRDLSDPRPIRTLARTVGDVPTLDALYLLTLADWSSVGPEAFQGWHRTLLHTLYLKTREHLESPDLFSDPAGVTDHARAALLRAELGEVPEAPGAGSDPIDDFLSALPTRYFQTVPADRILQHYHLWSRHLASAEVVVDVAAPAIDAPPLADGDLPPSGEPPFVEITVVDRDRPGLLARLAGALASSRFSVAAAEIHSLAGGSVLDLFRVADPHRRLADPRHADALRAALAAAVDAPEAAYTRRSGGLPSAADALPPLQTRVSASNDAASAHTVFDVQTTDRDGLLFDIAVFFRDRGLSVELALVTTEGRQAHDAFYVLDPRGEKLAPAAAQAHAEALSALLAG